VEFGRVLLIYADLVVNGKPPDEGDGSHTRRVSRVRLPNSPVRPFLARSLFLDEVYIAPKRGVPEPPDGDVTRWGRHGFAACNLPLAPEGST
jgi:hypothetical protein